MIDWWLCRLCRPQVSCTDALYNMLAPLNLTMTSDSYRHALVYIREYIVL